MLTNEQIQSLFTFCEKHFVKYYDVQVELVDHLANAIELEMQNDPKLTFERALEKVHQSFGVKGFAPLVAEKQNQAEKQSRKIFWKLLKAQFRWPKVLIFFLFLSFLFTLISFYPSSINWVSSGIIFICWPVFLIGMFRFRREIARTGKKFIVVNLSFIVSLLYLPVYFINFSNIFSIFQKANTFSYLHHAWKVSCLCIFLSLYIIAIFTLLQTISSVKKNLYKTYPEVFSISK